jgi:hypothetical protein
VIEIQPGTRPPGRWPRTIAERGELKGHGMDVMVTASAIRPQEIAPAGAARSRATPRWSARRRGWATSRWYRATCRPVPRTIAERGELKGHGDGRDGRGIRDPAAGIAPAGAARSRATPKWSARPRGWATSRWYRATCRPVPRTIAERGELREV